MPEAVYNIEETYGLVQGNGTQGICLYNINYYNKVLANYDTKENGDCFIVNDRVDEYNADLNNSTSSYNENAVDYDSGLSSVDVKNFVFGDSYLLSENTAGRSALDRTINNVSSRYNRNVGEYIITLGDLRDKTGNYIVGFTSGVKYIIEDASTKVTPENTPVDGTTQVGQYKIYGEQDKELTFTVRTSYTVASNYYAKYNENIVQVSSSGNVKLLSELVRYDYSVGENKFVVSARSLTPFYKFFF